MYRFIQQALTDQPLTIHGSGEQTRCFIYVDDLVAATVKVVESGLADETLNIATEEELSVLQIAGMILRETSVAAKIIHVPDRLGQVMRGQIDISEAKKLLNWTPKVNFEDGLKRTIRWVQSVI